MTESAQNTKKREFLKIISPKSFNNFEIIEPPCQNFVNNTMEWNNPFKNHCDCLTSLIFDEKTIPSAHTNKTAVYNRQKASDLFKKTTEMLLSEEQQLNTPPKLEEFLEHRKDQRVTDREETFIYAIMRNIIKHEANNLYWYLSRHGSWPEQDNHVKSAILALSSRYNFNQPGFDNFGKFKNSYDYELITSFIYTIENNKALFDKIIYDVRDELINTRKKDLEVKKDTIIKKIFKLPDEIKSMNKSGNIHMRHLTITCKHNADSLKTTENHMSDIKETIQMITDSEIPGIKYYAYGWEFNKNKIPHVHMIAFSTESKEQEPKISNISTLIKSKNTKLKITKYTVTRHNHDKKDGLIDIFMQAPTTNKTPEENATDIITYFTKNKDEWSDIMTGHPQVIQNVKFEQLEGIATTTKQIL